VSLVAFEPENDLETLIVAAKSGARPVADMMSALFKSGVFIAAKRELQPDGSGFDPLLLGEADAPLVAVFTSGPHATLHRDAASFVLRMTAVEFFRRLPTGYGVILNPGYDVQMVMPAHAIAEMRSKVLAGLEKAAPKAGG
jgi:hypothetical protein